MTSTGTIDWRRAIFWAFAVAALVTLLIGVDERFLFGHTGWCAARRAVAGRNFLKYGFLATHFGPVENYGIVTPGQFETYWHHPSGTHLLIGLSFRLLGVGEWQARLVPVLLMLGCFGCFHALARRWWRGYGLVAALAFFITMPMLGYYGPFVNQEALTLLAMLASTVLYVRWREAPSGRRAALAAAAAFLAAWSDWPWLVWAFGLALVELGRLARARRLDLRWLAPFSAAVLLGVLGVVTHLVLIEQAGHPGDPVDPVEGFKHIFGFRTGGEGESLGSVLAAGGHRWVELFTPGLIAAGLLWLPVAALDLCRRRATLRHAVAALSLAVGVVWVVVFRQGARIHEFWPLYAAPFFIIAAADLVERLGDLMAPRRWAHLRPLRAATGVLLVALIAAQAATGYAGILGRHRQPDRDNAHEGEDWRLRHTLLGEWLGANTEPDAHVAFQSEILASHFQVGFYADRAQKTFAMHESSRRLHVKEPWTWAVLDLRTLPQMAQTSVLRDVVRQHPVTVLAGFVIADLSERVETPRVTYLDVRSRPPTLLHRWLVSTIYAPFDIVADPLLAAAFLLDTGYRDEALEAYGRVATMPDDLRHRIADHNLAIEAHLEPEPPEGWLPRFLGLPAELDEPPVFGDRVTMLGARAAYTWRLGVVCDAVYRVDETLDRGWRAFIHRAAASIDEPDKRDIVAPQSVRIFPASEAWRPGQLLHLHRYFGLNRQQTGVDVRWGFWHEPTGPDSEQFLRVGGHNHLTTRAVDEIPYRPPPWFLRWLDFRWIEQEDTT